MKLKTAGLAQANQQLQEQVTGHQRAEARLADANRALQDAMAQMKTLKGLLPICAACKKIRDEAGQWKRIETYIMEHSDAQFTHGLCPDCVKEYLSELDQSLDEGAERRGMLDKGASPPA